MAKDTIRMELTGTGPDGSVELGTYIKALQAFKRMLDAIAKDLGVPPVAWYVQETGGAVNLRSAPASVPDVAPEIAQSNEASWSLDTNGGTVVK